MNAATKEKIEAFLKKAGFWKISGKEKWCESKTPHMKVVSLEGDIPDIYLSTGTARQEAEECGVGQLVDYKNMILQIYNSSEHQNEKPPKAGSHIPAPPQEQEVSKPPPSIPVPVSGGEAYQFICSACKKGITTEQRAATVKAVGKALCEACIHKTAVELAEKMKPKDEPVTLFHAYACYDCQKAMMTEQEGKASEKKYGFPVCKACSEIRDAKAAAEKTNKKPTGKKKDEPKTEKKTETPIPTQQGAETIKPAMCKDCGFELSHIRALEYQICEGCAEKRRVEAEKIVPLKPREKIMNEKTAIESAGKPGANAPATKSDHEIDEMIERAKARKFAEGQGSSYKVSGKERPDSAMIQKIANECGISTEILLAEQTDTYSHVVTRGHLGDTYVDAVVHHDFDIEFQLKTMEIIEKNPQILDHYEGIVPVIKEGAKIIKKTNQGEEQIDAKYYLIHALLSFKKFSLRDAATKSAAIVQLKLLNRDARDPEEIKSEQSERDLVEKQKRK